MSQELATPTKAFIEENIKLIENGEFIAVYKKLPQEISKEFTETMITAGILNLEIDNTYMPTTLSHGHFFTWHSRFKNVIESIGLVYSSLDKFTIEFSNEEKIKSYGGSLSWDELKCEIRKKWKLNKTIEKELNETQNAEDAYAKQLQSILAELISSCNRGRDYEEIRKNLDDLFDNLQFQELILGEYIHPRKIVLYTKNIQKTDLAKTSVEKAFESVFAHEMFHAYHYQDKSVELIKRCDYTSKVVKESLASAFEWQYRVEYKIPCEYNLENLWHRLHVFYYPYSGAKNLLTSYGCSGAHCLNKTKFYKIFTKSLSDMDGALRDLLDVNDFYKIKNAISIQTKYVVKPTSGAKRAEFDAIYSRKPVPTIAKEEIPKIIRAKPHLINDLMDRTYCKTIFDFDILREERDKMIDDLQLLYEGKLFSMKDFIEKFEDEVSFYLILE